ncbi:MAG: SEC-C domain-containing protein, partial [Chloroflexi bacterium]|nr:SEC-C domain-containing protein [Chloroflexota bacterium]
IDDMRRGIGLRGYAQQDPLNEFRKEAFRLYEELRDLIRRGVATTIFRVSVKREPATTPLSGPGQPGRPSDGHDHDHGPSSSFGSSGATSASGSATGAPRAPLTAGGAALRQPGSAAATVGGTAAPIRGLPADPMRTAREVPGDAAVSGASRPGYTPSGARIGRNDPCWCASGQKYKKCHGA